tara:strand:+ start:23 stop:544 length:522 start_codon:yes stop_codon:yes gene_type:complete
VLPVVVMVPCTPRHPQVGQKTVDPVVVEYQVNLLVQEILHQQVHLKEMLVAVVLDNQVAAVVVPVLMVRMLLLIPKPVRVVRELVLLVETLEFQIVMEHQDHSLVDILQEEAAGPLISKLRAEVESAEVVLARKRKATTEPLTQEVVVELVELQRVVLVDLALSSLDTLYKIN